MQQIDQYGDVSLEQVLGEHVKYSGVEWLFHGIDLHFADIELH